MNITPLTHRLAIVLVIGGLAAGCGKEPVAAPTHTTEAAATPASGNRVAIPAVVRANLGLTFAPVERRQVEATMRIPGAFEWQPRARREYRLSLPGTVELVVDQLQSVKAGETLYRLRSPEWLALQEELIQTEQAIPAALADMEVARAAVAEAAARIDAAQGRLNALAEAGIRNAELEERIAAVRAGVPRLEAELKRADVTLAAAISAREHAYRHASVASRVPEARLIELDATGVPLYRSMDVFDVTATADGIVESLATTDGAFAEVPTVVLTTVDPSMLRFRARAPQADLKSLSSATGARIVPAGGAATPSTGAIPATMVIGLDAQPSERTIDVFAEPQASDASAPLPGWARAGVSAFLEFVTDGGGSPMLAIPKAAVVRDGLKHVFFRRDPNDPNTVIRIEADLGTDDGQWVVINSGLSPNDTVVVDGAYELMLASAQSGTQQQGGHFHADGTFHGEPD